MKIQVVKDKSGKPVGSFESASASGATVSPVLEQGQKVEAMEVAEGYHDKLQDIYKS